ncbi:F-box/kelch-repeat protein At3g06240-like [Lycium ferocissimum]|uniref:F-box/kelch-repeat protein At3g06240-like n=1 Tax=Lycium ferocissimum TaxID=112874 RepID=UPI0028156422|nr:F-box/kelch-repeat protein At3g06240-like [Lycium ferocissimum]
MAMSKAETLPQEIIIDILSLLPTKYIGQYRYVSKQWCNFLSDPQFIKFHLTIHAHKQEKKLIFISHSHALHTIMFNHNGTDVTSRKLNFQGLSHNWVRVVGSCNGLVLVVNEENIIFLINPTTLKYHRIPNFDLAIPKLDSCSVYGLGYDLVSDDCKVVTLSRYRGRIDSTFVDVYSLRMGLWRRLESLPHYRAVRMRASGVLVNGPLRWLARKAPDFSYVIVAFDLSTEKFLEVPTPTTLDNNNLLFNKLSALRGCLCMLYDTLENEIDIWMMREYRVEESWTRFRVARMGIEYGLVPFCTISDDDIVLNVDREKLTVYNMKEDQWRDMKVDGITAKFERTETFIESLVSPMFGK